MIMAKTPNLELWSLQDLHAARLNVLVKLDDPKFYEAARKRLIAIEAEIERRSLPGMIKRFMEVYPGGFYGEKQALEERDYKIAASEMSRTLLSPAEFDLLCRDADWSALHLRLKRIVSATNLIQGSFEKPKLIDTLAESTAAARFFPALNDCLHGDGDNFFNRFNRFCKVLEELGLSKWTYATYFAFLHHPDTYIFVKPKMLQDCVAKSGHWLEYSSQPTGPKYKEIIDYAKWLKTKIWELNPRDMIDVHSFMWHMAPTGKWEES